VVYLPAMCESARHREASAEADGQGEAGGPPPVRAFLGVRLAWRTNETLDDAHRDSGLSIPTSLDSNQNEKRQGHF
jgi:hypothetical protein